MVIRHFRLLAACLVLAGLILAGCSSGNQPKMQGGGKTFSEGPVTTGKNKPGDTVLP